jgi:hypothetical protein
MARSLCIEPIVGDWYQSHGHLFEVIAIDDTDRLIEVQHADGDLEEIDMDDWNIRCRASSLKMAESPEDSRLAEDRPDPDDSEVIPAAFKEIHGLRADALNDLDLFEQQ